MKTATVRRRLRELWAGVDPYPVVAMLRRQAQSDPEGAQELLDEACALAPEEAATLLIQPALTWLRATEPDERGDAWRALDSLVRAGADPTEALPVAASALGTSEGRSAAARLLRRAALRGASLASVAEELLGIEVHPDVRSVQRLALLEREDSTLLLALGQAYEGQRVANLFPALALLEEQLLTEAAEEARDALVAVVDAGEDLLASWVALLPVLLRQLGHEPHQREAARMLGQLRFADGDDAASRLPPLQGVAVALAPLLTAAAPVAREAARTLELLAATETDLEPVATELRAGTHSDSRLVRSCCSRALSLWLCRTGVEAPLPPGQSHRRVHAANDEPFEGTRSRRCPACNESGARLIFEWDDGAQFYRSGLTEVFCPACQVYTVHEYQSPG